MKPYTLAWWVSLENDAGIKSDYFHMNSNERQHLRYFLLAMWIKKRISDNFNISDIISARGY